MTLTPAQMDRKIDEHFAFEAADDVEGVLATMAPDVDHDIVGWPSGPTHGRENARPFYVTLFADLADGKVTVTDGPFTESKEWIVGYDLLECEDLDQAIDYVSRHPMARRGRIEIRPVAVFDE